ncbi:MAG: carboxypeptidase-like regulatory domain-containing protein [Prevotella sp.]|uniref:TonB-dependent receptor n=1 Tax=Prevotella sp. TaxID=59823 RepID=UPI002A840634|nr:carboxypeptidase-like regulatory domain-containing protein [Prevotella sp.]MDY4020458.1 carboxypeptidase-like regulatory domain-containing protein [Prevotella sp.]
MKMKRIISGLLFIFIATAIYAQSFTLQGRVTDQENNPVELASVVSQGKLTMTNLNGEFSIELQSADSVTVRFSMIGYKTKTRVLRNPKGKMTLQVQLFDAGMLDEVVITEQRRQTGTTQEIDVKQIGVTPSASGNKVEELIQQQAGVSTHSELSSQYNVRGGTFDENSVYINDVEVYRPFLVRSGQQEGLSIINGDMVEKIGFSSGGYEAKYGDKMSSALDITYKRPKKSEATVTASFLGASAYVGLSTKKLSWTNGIRYKTNKYLLGSLETKGEYDPSFIDYQTYLSYQPNKRWTIDFIGNISENRYNFKPEDRETNFGTMENVKSFKVYFDGQEKDLFRTFFGSLSITRNFTENTKFSLIGSAFKTREQETYDIQGQYWLTQTETSENLGVGTYMEHARNYLNATVASVKMTLNHKTKKHNIQAGLTFKFENINEKTREYEMRDSSGYSVPHTGKDLYMIYSLDARNELKAKRIETYLQDTYKFTYKGNFFTLNYGVRFSHWDFNKESIFSPRVSLGIVPAFNEDMTFRFATGLYYQAPFFKELRDTMTVNNVTYATLNNKVKSQRSIHFIAGMDYRFKMANRPFKFSAEAYFKLLGNLVPYSVNNVKVVYDASQQCSGSAMGLDLKLFGEFVEGNDSWVTLSVMNTRMKLNGQSIPLPTDQRFALNLFFTDYFPGTDKWKMSLKLAYADGLPFGAPHRRLDIMPFRAAAYKRADIGMSFRAFDNDKRQKKSILRNIWIGIDCLNLLGINNVNSYYWITDVTNQQYAVPNYLTGRQINGRVLLEF